MSNADITVAYQDNISDMNMFYDAKHLHESKVPVYAKNIINKLLRGYGIIDKKEMFVPSTEDHRNEEFRCPSSTTDIDHRLKQVANYGDMNEGTRERGWQQSSSSPRFGKNTNTTTTTTNNNSNNNNNDSHGGRSA